MNDADALQLRALLAAQPVAALATLHRNEPAVSMVPYALLPDGSGIVVHVSGLATHTKDMLEAPAVALLVTATPAEAHDPLALPRASIQGTAGRCDPASDAHAAAGAAYLARLPQARPLFDFPDFSLFVIAPRALRYVAGFGRAMSVTGERLREVLTPQVPPAP